MKKNLVRWSTLGIAYASVAVSAVVCMNYLHEGPGSSKGPSPTVQIQSKSGGSAPHSGSGSTPVAAVEATITGNWRCADSSCDQDTIKSITENKDSTYTVDTKSSVEDQSTASVCRVHEVATLNITSNTDDENYEGDLTTSELDAAPSSENTGNCSQVYKTPESPKANSTRMVALVQNGQQQITIDGVRYRRATIDEMQQVSRNHSGGGSLPQHSGLAGSTWSCIDKGSEDDQLVFAADLKSAKMISVQDLDANDNCEIAVEPSISSIEEQAYQDKKSGQKFNAEVLTIMTAPLILIQPDTCSDAIDQYNQQHANTSTTTRTLKMDGLNMLSLGGRHYMRQGVVTASSAPVPVVQPAPAAPQPTKPLPQKQTPPRTMQAAPSVMAVTKKK